MNRISKTAVIIGLTGLFSGGLGCYVAAQSPSFALPPLPGAPAAPTPSSAPASTATTTSAPAAPSAALAPSPSVTVGSATQVPVKSSTPPLPNESIDKSTAAAAPPVSTASSALPALEPAGGLGSLPPPAPSAQNLPVVPTPFPIAATPAPVEVKKAPEKTWLTKLAPSITPPALGYHYRRELLPDAIYRTHYDAANRHLPVAMTRDDYTRLFLISVARNDINATRALLNEGVPVNATNARGETALALAQRYGANDTARLLMAHGAQ